MNTGMCNSILAFYFNFFGHIMMLCKSLVSLSLTLSLSFYLTFFIGLPPFCKNRELNQSVRR